MAIVTKTRFSDIIFSNGDSIQDRGGSKLIQSFGSRGANSYIGIKNGISESPEVISTGANNIGLNVKIKGSSFLKIYSDGGNGAIVLENNLGGYAGLRPLESSLSSYFLTFPSDLPPTEKILTINSQGKMGYSSVSPGGEISISRENKSGSNYASTTSVNGVLFKRFSFSNASDFLIYHQSFLNGILQYGLVLSTSNASLVSSGDADYLFDNTSVYFSSDHIDDDDIISLFGG
jgi:hypothetical protein